MIIGQKIYLALCIYTLDRDILQKINDSKLVFLLQKENVHDEYILSSTKGMNVHVMNKFSLERLLNE